MDVGVRPYSSKKSLQRPPFVGPLTDTCIQMDPTPTFLNFLFYIFYSLVNSFTSPHSDEMTQVSTNLINVLGSNTTLSIHQR